MRDAFRALDKDNNGRVQEVELRTILGTLGDSLTQQEVIDTHVFEVLYGLIGLRQVNSLLREIKVESDGSMDYNAFVDKLVNGYPVGDKL